MKNINFDDLVKSIESIDDSPSKKKKTKKKINKKNKKKENTKESEYRDNSVEMRMNLNENTRYNSQLSIPTVNLYDNGNYCNEFDKEIEEFIRKLKECSIPAHLVKNILNNQSSKIKPIISQEWNIFISQGLIK